MSVTCTLSGLGKFVFTRVDCPSPLTAVRLAGEPAVLSRLNETGVRPSTAAVTENGPALVFAVSGALALPDASVTTVIDDTPPANVPVGPNAGAVNVTGTPAIGLPFLVSV